MVKGHGLYRLMTEAVHTQEEEEYVDGLEEKIEMYDVVRSTPVEDGNSWYTNVCQYLEDDTVTSHFSIR